MQTAERTRFTEAEMATVRDTDLPDLLISLGYQVKRIGRYYTTQEMDSIRIKVCSRPRKRRKKFPLPSHPPTWITAGCLPISASVGSHPK